MAAKVAIKYGIFTGKHVGKKFRRALVAHGYTPVDDISAADIIIGHSAGCFWLERTKPNQKLVLIDPPYWPGKTAKQRAKSRTNSHLHYRKNGFPLHYWIRRTWWGLYYAVIDVPRNRKIVRYADSFDLKQVIEGRSVVLIRNQNDDWLTSNLKDLAAINPAMKIVHIPGDHDDCWFNPKPYIKAINELT